MPHLIDLFLHLDKHLAELVQNYGTLSYFILTLILFCETGLVVTPFLPGDSLLFAAGALASTGALNPVVLMALMIAGALCGDLVNYNVGRFLGPRAFDKKYERFLKPAYLQRTQKFFDKHGGQAVIMARFVPIVRTYVPFMAGIGQMKFFRFATYSVGAACLWVLLLVGGGYLFGGIPVVKNNFSIVVLAIIVISVMPMVIEFIKHRKESASALTQVPAAE